MSHFSLMTSKIASVGGGSSSKVQQLLEGLQSGDESVQLQAALEMCQLLVMANEDDTHPDLTPTSSAAAAAHLGGGGAAGFPTKQTVAALSDLLGKEHNFELMNVACRALTYLMQLFPRSTTVVVDCVPLLLQKVEHIECMDVGEQSVCALEMLSRRHHRTLLHAGAIHATLLYLDFFSIQAQRSALSVVANCCQSVTSPSLLHSISASLLDLGSRLAAVSGCTTSGQGAGGDSKCTHSIVLAFSRLVDNFILDHNTLDLILSPSLLLTLQQLLSSSPPVLTGQCSRLVVRLLSSVAGSSASLATQLLRNHIHSTILHLLIGPTAASAHSSPANPVNTPPDPNSPNQFEAPPPSTPILDMFTEAGSRKSPSPNGELRILPKNSQELLEITTLIYNLMPSVPPDDKGLHEVDDLLSTPNPLAPLSARRSEWPSSNNAANGGEEAPMHTSNACHSQQPGEGAEGGCGGVLEGEGELCGLFVRSLFPCLYHMYSSSAAAKQVKHRVLQSIRRMLHLSSAPLLADVLRGYSLSSDMARMLSSEDLHVAASAVQMSFLLLHKLPAIFSVCFRREGLLHEMEKLTHLEVNMELAQHTHSTSTSRPDAFKLCEPRMLPGLLELTRNRHSMFDVDSSSSPSPGDLEWGEEEHPVSHLHMAYKSLQASAASGSRGAPDRNEQMLSSLLGVLPVGSQFSSDAPSGESGSSRMSNLYNSIVAARKDYPVQSSKKKKPPSMPTTAAPLSSKRSRRTKSESAPHAQEGVPVATVPPTRSEQTNQTPSLHTLLSRSFFPNPFRTNSQISDTSLNVHTTPATLDPVDPFLAGTVQNSVKPNSRQTSTTHSSKGSASGGGAASFFSNLKPMKWHMNSKSKSTLQLDKMPPGTNGTAAVPMSAGVPVGLANGRLHSPPEFFSSHSVPTPALLAGWEAVTEEKIKLWLKQKASLFLHTYSKNLSDLAAAADTLDIRSVDLDHLAQLQVASHSLDITKMTGDIKLSEQRMQTMQLRGFVVALRGVCDLLGLGGQRETAAGGGGGGGGASPFEVAQSGLVAHSLLPFLTLHSPSPHLVVERTRRLHAFCHVFLNCPEPCHSLVDNSNCMDMGTPLSSSRSAEGLNGPPAGDTGMLEALVCKLIQCLHQLEQFPVRVTDLQSIAGPDMYYPMESMSLSHSLTHPSSSSSSSWASAGGSGGGGGGCAGAIKFFNTHQLKCVLERHPCCKNGAKQWKGGPVRIDPLAQIHSVEKFLLAKGVVGGKGSGGVGMGEPELDSDEDGNEVLLAMLTGHHSSSSRHSSNPQQHRLKLIIGQTEVPYDWTVYQAIHQLGHKQHISSSSTQISTTHDFSLFGMGDGAGRNKQQASHRTTNIWLRTHTIYYAAAEEWASTESAGSETSNANQSELLSCWMSGRGAGVTGTGGEKSQRTSGGGKSGRSSRNSTDHLWNEGQVPGLRQEQQQTSALEEELDLIASVAAAVQCERRKSTSDQTGTAAADVSDKKNKEKEKECSNREVHVHSSSSSFMQDPSIEVLLLLRVLHSLNTHWKTLYQQPQSILHSVVSPSAPAVPASCFLSVKLQSKVSRQLQDPLGVMTGDMPPWIHHIPRKFPFLLDFETKRTLLYVTAFDRDRALLRLQEMAQTEGGGSERGGDGGTGQGTASSHPYRQDSSDTITPRLDRKKRIVTRQCGVGEGEGGSGSGGVMLKEAESVLEEMGSWRGLLELQFRDEVGSGLGPTLEWYTLVSHHLMRTDLLMWRHSTTTNTTQHTPTHSPSSQPPAAFGGLDVTSSVFGLFPRPYGRSAKSTLMSKVRARFRLLGKLLARALMDNRTLDLSLGEPFYKWLLLGQQCCLNADDLRLVDPDLHRIFCRFQQLVERKKQLEADTSLNASSLQLALESLTLDNSSIESLDLRFELPGYDVEMRKGGSDMPVTIHNLEQYLELLLHWTLREGVGKQMEAVREGFNSVCPLHHLSSLFFPHQLDQLFCGGVEQDSAHWTPQNIADCAKFDHGYTRHSEAVEWFLTAICSLSPQQKRLFLQFITGSPKLPVGGFRSLSPPLTIVRKAAAALSEGVVGGTEDDVLPSVMTCVNYLKLPQYSSATVMRQRIVQAITEGQHSFDLS